MPTFDAGSIEAKLTLDRSEFNRELRAAQADAKKFERDPIKKKLDVDRRDYDKKIDEAALKAKKLGQEKPEVKIQGDTSDWEKDFRKTLAEAEELARKTTDVRIDADVKTARARAELAKLNAEADRLSGKKVKIDVDSSGLSLMTGRMSLLTTALIGLAPAAIPAIAGVTAATAGLAAVLSAATGAVGVFGVGMIASVTPAIKLNQELSKLNEKLEQTEDVAKRAEIIQQIGAITRQMTPEVREFTNELQALGASWKAFGEAAGTDTLPVASRALQILGNALEPLPGVIKELAPSFNGWMHGIENFIRGDGYRGFLGFIMTEGPPALDNLGRLIGNLTTGIGGLLRSFTPFGQDFLRVLTEGSERFSDWANQLGQTSGFRSFIDYVNDRGPELVSTLGAVIDSLIDVGVALAPLAGPTLAVVKVFAEMVSAVADLAPGLVQLGLAALVVGRTLVGLSEFILTLGVRMTRLKAAFATVQGVLVGPWGIAVAAAVTALGLLAVGHAEAKQRSDDLKASLDQTTGAITKLSRETISKTLIDTGAVKLARDFGISLGDLQAAAEGNGPAFERVNDQIDAFINAQVAASGENVRMDKGLVDLSRKAQDLRRILGGTTGAIAEQRDVIRDTNELQGGYIDTTSGLRFATEAEAQAHADAGRKIKDQRDALAGLVAQQKASREEALRLASAEINYEQSLDDATEAAKANGKTHDINTQKGRDNARALIALGDAQQKLTDDTKFMKLSTQDQIAVLKDQRRQFIAVARDMGYTKQQAADLADQYLKLPKEVSTKAKLAAETKKLNDWKTGLDSVNDQIVTVSKLILDSANLQAWDKDLDGIPDSVDTDAKFDPDKPHLSLWNKLLAAVPKKTKTDGTIRGDYEDLRNWQSGLRKVPRSINTVLSVTLAGYNLAMARLAILQAAAAARIGGERGGVIGANILGLPAYQIGGIVDMRSGGTQPGFSAKDNRIGLFRDGEGVLIPEAVDRIGGPQAIEAINDAARTGRVEDVRSSGRLGRGSAITIEQLIVHNPIGKPTEDSVMDRVSDLNVMFS